MSQNMLSSQGQNPAGRSHRYRMIWISIKTLLILMVLGMTVRGCVFFMFDNNRGTTAKSYPAWSPDGNHIAFVSRHDGDENIYLMNPDGSNIAQLTSDPLRYFYLFRDPDDREPAWSPDGKKIVFVSERNTSADSPADLYIMDTRGRNLLRLTRATDNLQSDLWYGYRHPAWSPDGKRIAFLNGSAIYVIDAEGSNPTKITNIYSPYIPSNSLSWSPDGNYIAFVDETNGYDYNSDIYIIKADGSDKKQLTTNFIIWAGPAWSPDGRNIVFAGRDMSACSDCDADLYAIHPDGNHLVRLAAYPSGQSNGHISWSPDGSRLVFSDSYAIYTMNADGSGLQYISGIH